MTKPHKGVFTRLGVSSIHGVGLFAIQDIPAGTLISFGDEEKPTWVSRKEVEQLSPELQKLYFDMCVEEEGCLAAPKSFNVMSLMYFANHSATPNAYENTEGDSFALVDIKKGDEITFNYDRFPKYREIE